MKSYSSKIGVHNMTDGPRVIWIEPWGGDFTLLSNEEIEIVVSDSAAVPCFNLVEHQQSTQIYVEVPDPTHTEYVVTLDGKQLKPGHNHDVAVAAGISM